MISSSSVSLKPVFKSYIINRIYLINLRSNLPDIQINRGYLRFEVNTKYISSTRWSSVVKNTGGVKNHALKNQYFSWGHLFNLI